MKPNTNENPALVRIIGNAYKQFCFKLCDNDSLDVFKKNLISCADVAQQPDPRLPKVLEHLLQTDFQKSAYLVGCSLKHGESEISSKLLLMLVLNVHMTQFDFSENIFALLQTQSFSDTSKCFLYYLIGASEQMSSAFQVLPKQLVQQKSGLQLMCHMNELRLEPPAVLQELLDGPTLVSLAAAALVTQRAGWGSRFFGLCGPVFSEYPAQAVMDCCVRAVKTAQEDQTITNVTSILMTAAARCLNRTNIECCTIAASAEADCEVQLLLGCELTMSLVLKAIAQEEIDTSVQLSGIEGQFDLHLMRLYAQFQVNQSQMINFRAIRQAAKMALIDSVELDVYGLPFAEQALWIMGMDLIE